MNSHLPTKKEFYDRAMKSTPAPDVSIKAPDLNISEREAFEDWIKSHGGSVDRISGSEYRSAPTECAWSAWQARAKQAAPFQPDWVNYRQGVLDGQVERQAVSDGFVLVPIDPTEEMLFAMHEALYDVRSQVWHDGLQFVYSKLLSAAPTEGEK